MNSHVQLTCMDQSPCSLLFGLPRWSAGYSCLYFIFLIKGRDFVEEWQLIWRHGNTDVEHWRTFVSDFWPSVLKNCAYSLYYLVYGSISYATFNIGHWFSSWLVCHKEAGEFVGLLMQNKHFITGHTLSSVKEIRRLCHVRYDWVRFSPTWQKCHIWYC